MFVMWNYSIHGAKQKFGNKYVIYASAFIIDTLIKNVESYF